MTRTVLGTSIAPDELMAQDRAPDPGNDVAGVAAALFAQLTARQRLISIWMTAGFSSEEIAHHLGITQRAVNIVSSETARVFRSHRPQR